MLADKEINPNEFSLCCDTVEKLSFPRKYAEKVIEKITTDLQQNVPLDETLLEVEMILHQ